MALKAGFGDWLLRFIRAISPGRMEGIRGEHDERGRDGVGRAREKRSRGPQKDDSEEDSSGRCCEPSETAERLPPTLIMLVRN